MAGVGVTLKNIFEKNTIVTNLAGFGYSSAITVAPMFVVIGEIIIAGRIYGFNKVSFANRELFSCTVLYIFIFALLTASPFNAVLSKYMSDVIYEERYEDILPCFYLGLIMNVVLSCVLGVPFCLWEYFVGKVALYYVFTGFCGYISLVLVFYSMLYLSICKDYKKISIFFALGMLVAFCLNGIAITFWNWDASYAMLFSLVVGFWLIACLELAVTKQYFVENSKRYKRVLEYMWIYKKLVGTNFLYILGLYIHNFVFWTTDMRIVVAKSFVCAQPYDMASCIAMFTNISATVIFISRVEMYFHERYKAYSEAVIGGRGMDIINTKKRMFRQLSTELMNLVRIQFIVSVVIYLICITFLPRFGFSDLVMNIYPGLAAGYFILFIMYSVIIFLYYFDDLNGAFLTSLIFCVTTCFVSIFATTLTPLFYGVGVVVGAVTAFIYAYVRVRWIEEHMDVLVFCKGSILTRGKGEMPSSKVR